MSEHLELAAPAGGLILSGGDITLEASAGDGKGPKRFSAVAYNGGPMKTHLGTTPVIVDLAGLSVSNQRLPVLREHNAERMIGHSENIDIKAKSIKVSGLLSGQGEDVDKVLATSANGYPWQASIGVGIDSQEYVEAGQSATVNGAKHQGPLIIIRKSRWRELSFVTLGADNSTSAVIHASLSGDSIMTFSQWLAAKNIDEATTPEHVLNVLKAAYKAEQTPPPAPPPENKPQPTGDALTAAMAAQRAENLRTQGITDMVAKAAAKTPHKVDEFEAIAKEAINQGWDIERTEMRVLVASLATAAPMAFSPSRGDCTADVLECSFAQACGLSEKTLLASYGERTMHTAAKHFNGSISGLHELIGFCAAAAGFRGVVSKRNLKAAMEAVTQADLRASVGPSTYSLTGILSNVAKKSIKEQFLFVPQEWNKLCARRSVSDFKTIKSYTLTGDLTYKLIPPGGEIKAGTVSEIEYENRADSYGKLIMFDRRDMINDDLGALNQIYRRIGRGGALTLNKHFWELFHEATTNGFFDEARGNYDDGNDTVFGTESLVAADLLWSAMLDPDGQEMDHVARYLLVPPALRIPALRLMNSQEVFEDSDAGGSNPWAGAFEVISSKRLQSSKAWFLFADPLDTPCFEVALLDGQEMPTIESVEPGPDRLGLVIRAYHDFGFALQEYRGGLMMKGEI